LSDSNRNTAETFAINKLILSRKFARKFENDRTSSSLLL